MNESNDSGPLNVDGLSTRERALAGVAGVGLSSVGAWATLKSDNQAGTVALLLVGGALLVLAVQGTPLAQLGTEKGSFVLAQRRKKDLDLVLRVKEEEGSEEAAEVAERLATVDPPLANARLVRGVSYERDVIEALHRVSGGTGTSAATVGGDYGYDAIITRGQRAIEVEVKWSSGRRLPAASLRRALARWRISGTPIGSRLLVCNVDLTPEAANMLNTVPEVRFVRWRGPEDDEVLREAVAAALGGR